MEIQWLDMPDTIGQKNQLFPLGGLGALVKNQGTINVRVSFWAHILFHEPLHLVTVLEQSKLQPWQSGGRCTYRVQFAK